MASGLPAAPGAPQVKRAFRAPSRWQGFLSAGVLTFPFHLKDAAASALPAHPEPADRSGGAPGEASAGPGVAAREDGRFGGGAGELAHGVACAGCLGL